MAGEKAPEMTPKKPPNNGEPGKVQRMCVICRRRFDQGELTRYVLGLAGGLVLDERKILPGRGYYCCRDAGCEARFTGFKPRKGGKKLRRQGEKR